MQWWQHWIESWTSYTGFHCGPADHSGDLCNEKEFFNYILGDKETFMDSYLDPIAHRYCRYWRWRCCCCYWEWHRYRVQGARSPRRPTAIAPVSAPVSGFGRQFSPLPAAPSHVRIRVPCASTPSGIGFMTGVFFESLKRTTYLNMAYGRMENRQVGGFLLVRLERKLLFKLLEALFQMGPSILLQLVVHFPCTNAAGRGKGRKQLYVISCFSRATMCLLY